MKVSLKWLNDFVDLSGIDTDEIVARLTAAGLEVERVDVRSAEGVVVGRIEAIDEHPTADRLVMCRVDVGDGTTRNIACGATNMHAGDVVPVALPGSQPPGIDFEITAREVAGVMSEGMLCAEEELGLADASEGLWILTGDLELGAPIFEALGLDDTVIGLDLTPNRADCLSHQGVGRELAALFDLEFVTSEPLGLPEGKGAVGEVASLDVRDPEGCPRYLLAIVEAIEVGESPDWLKQRLSSIGVRSINNVVDTTNYVLQHLGHPLHAFDLDKLNGGITVRRAEVGEKMVGIDHKEYTLTTADLVIADSEGPVAIAGVMGGERTEVSDDTSRVLIECAYFDPTSVRKSAKRLGLHTDSSHRFERGVDPNGLMGALEIATDLISGFGQAQAREGYLEFCPEVIEGPEIDLPTRLNARILGIELSADVIAGLLGPLGIETRVEEEVVHSKIPTFRPDLTRPIDLVEEVARLYGYDKIEPRFAEVTLSRHHAELPEPGHEPTIVSREVRSTMERMHTKLLGLGMYEAVNYSFMSEEELDRLRLDEDDARRDAVRVANPLAQGQGLMRTSLVPSLLRMLETNVAQRAQDIAVFEFGRIYPKDGEREMLAILVTGTLTDHFENRRSWDFYDLKGLVNSLVHPFDLDLAWDVPRDSQPYLHPGVQAEARSQSGVIARVGQVHPVVVHDQELSEPVFIAEIELDLLLGFGRAHKKHGKIPRFPAVTRDFAFLVSRDVQWASFERAFGDLASKDAGVAALIESMRLFDVYEGEQVPDDKRSLALKVVYRSDERTLTDDEVTEADKKLLSWLESEIGAKLR